MAAVLMHNLSLRSLHSTYQVNVRFTNTSERIVNIYWIDYIGNRVCYYSDIQPGRMTNIQTFISHPWVAHDSVTGQKLLMNGHPAYIPILPPHLRSEEMGEFGLVGMDEQQQQANALIQAVLSAMPLTEIKIHIPVFRLEDICIGFFRKYLNAEGRMALEVSKYLSEKLKTPQIDCTFYTPPQ